MRTVSFFAYPLLLLLLFGTVLADESCGASSCQLHASLVTINAGQYIFTQEIDAIAGATLSFGMVMNDCHYSKRDDADCNVVVLILSPSQYDTLLQNQGDYTTLNLDGGLTFYDGINSGNRNFNASIYFGEDTTVRIIFATVRGDNVNPGQYTQISYDVNYNPAESCMTSLSGFVFTVVALIVLLVGGKILFTFFGQKVTMAKNKSINAGIITDVEIQQSISDTSNDILMEQQENQSLEHKEKSYHQIKQLLDEKNRRPWILRPAGPRQIRKPILTFVSRPRYHFGRYWVYTHHWFSLCFAGPNPILGRFSKLSLVLTLFMIRMFMLLVASESMYSTNEVIAKSESSTLWNVIVRYTPVVLLVYVIEYFLGEIYEKLLAWKNRAEKRTDGEGFVWRVANPENRQGLRIVNILLKYSGEILLGLITTMVVISTFVLMLEGIDCEAFWQFVVGLILVEFFKAVFPGVLFIWLIYLVLNTFGTNPTIENPWNDEEEDMDDEVPEETYSDGELEGDSD